MAYTALTTAGNIQGYFQNITFSASTKPTLTEVQDWIARATSVIYGAIEEQYVIPITDADDLAQLKELADLYVVTKIKQVIAKTPAKRAADGSMTYKVENFDEFNKRLDYYINGAWNLPNSPRNTTKERFVSYNSTNSITAVSNKSGDIW